MTSRRDKRSDESGSSATSNNTAATTISPTSPKEVLPLLVPPTEEEATRFYSAFPSRPRLIGRTSSGIDPWVSRLLNPGEPYPEYQHRLMSPLGEHKIRLVWDDVEPRIIAAIDRLPWTSVDIWRISKNDERPQQRPVVVWVGIDSSKVLSLPWDTVAQSLRACRIVLDAADLADVECEMRVSNVSSLAGNVPPMLSPTAHEEFSYFAQPFTTAIGQPIYPTRHNDTSGTLCIYLRPARTAHESPQVWALTCRHVALPNSSYRENMPYKRTTTSQPALRMASPRQKEINDAMDGLDFRIKRASESLIERDVDKKKKDKLQDRIDDATALQRAIRPFQHVDSRVIGHVFLSPSIGVGEGWTFPWMRDWALIELDTAKYPTIFSRELVNEVDLRTSDQELPHKLSQDLNSDIRNKTIFTYPRNGLLRLRGIVTVAQMEKPATIDKDGEECILVGMHGAVTGLSWGCPSELLSTVRTAMPDGSSIRTRDWAVKGSAHDKEQPFSKPGDSGAAVFDVHGRLGGMLTRGCGDRGLFDVTYVTPMEILLADIERLLGMEVVVL